MAHLRCWEQIFPSVRPIRHRSLWRTSAGQAPESTVYGISFIFGFIYIFLFLPYVLPGLVESMTQT